MTSAYREFEFNPGKYTENDIFSNIIYLT